MKLYFEIINHHARENFENLYNISGNITVNKSWEFEIIRYSRDFVRLLIDLSWKGRDHAGPEILIGLFGYSMSAKIYDNRHWNWETKDWEIVDNDTAQ